MSCTGGASQTAAMNSIRQIAIELPEGLQRLQLHLFANGLVGWSPEAEGSNTEATQTEPQDTANRSSNSSDEDGAAQTPAPQLNLRSLFDRLNVLDSAQDDSDEDHNLGHISTHGSNHFDDVCIKQCQPAWPRHE